MFQSRWIMKAFSFAEETCGYVRACLSLSVPVSLSPLWNKNHTFNVQGVQSLIHTPTHIHTHSLYLAIRITVILKCLKHINNMPFLTSSVCTRSTCVLPPENNHACTLSPALTKALVFLPWVFSSALSLMKHTRLGGQCGRIHALWTNIVCSLHFRHTRLFSYCEHFTIMFIVTSSIFKSYVTALQWSAL